MAEKILNSRIQLKHDTEVNWGKAENFIPKIGEAILYDADNNHDCVRIKIGDGVTPINNLPFATDYNETIADIKIEGTVLSYTKGNGVANSYDIKAANGIYWCEIISTDDGYALADGFTFEKIVEAYKAGYLPVFNMEGALAPAVGVLEDYQILASIVIATEGISGLISIMIEPDNTVSVAEDALKSVYIVDFCQEDGEFKTDLYWSSMYTMYSMGATIIARINYLGITDILCPLAEASETGLNFLSPILFTDITDNPQPYVVGINWYSDDSVVVQESYITKSTHYRVDLGIIELNSEGMSEFSLPTSINYQDLYDDITLRQKEIALCGRIAFDGITIPFVANYMAEEHSNSESTNLYFSGTAVSYMDGLQEVRKDSRFVSFVINNNSKVTCVTLLTTPAAITDDEIDSICGAAIYYESEVSV